MQHEGERPDAAVNSITYDEDQIAREPVFRAERIPERIDRPMPRIHVRGLSAFCLKAFLRHAAESMPFSLSACFFRIHGS